MSAKIPRDAVYFVCLACGAKAWLTKEEATHCVGKAIGVLSQVQTRIDIPPHPGSREQRPKVVLEESEYGLVADKAPVARSPPDSLPNPAPCACAAPAPRAPHHRPETRRPRTPGSGMPSRAYCGRFCCVRRFREGSCPGRVVTMATACSRRHG